MSINCTKTTQNWYLLRLVKLTAELQKLGRILQLNTEFAIKCSVILLLN